VARTGLLAIASPAFRIPRDAARSLEQDGAGVRAALHVAGLARAAAERQSARAILLDAEARGEGITEVAAGPRLALVAGVFEEPDPRRHRLRARRVEREIDESEAAAAGRIAQVATAFGQRFGALRIRFAEHAIEPELTVVVAHARCTLLAGVPQYGLGSG